MWSKTRRILVYLFIDSVLAAIGYLLSFFSTEYSLILTFVILGLFVTLLLEILLEVSRVSEVFIDIIKKYLIPVDIINGERNLKREYRELREGACEVKAVWCSRYADVDKYFKNEINDLNHNPQLTIKRLVNPNVVKSSDYINHLALTQTLRKNGRYQLKITDLTELECVVSEYENKGQREWKALLVLNNVDTHTPAMGILFDPSKNEECRSSLAAVSSWFDREWNKPGSAIIP